jgi:hypothetical protein
VSERTPNCGWMTQFADRIESNVGSSEHSHADTRDLGIVAEVNTFAAHRILRFTPCRTPSSVIQATIDSSDLGIMEHPIRYELCSPRMFRVPH